MIFRPSPLNDAFVIEPERIEDDRGFFARSFCAREFETHGLNPRMVQCNISYNVAKGTLRGMHYQIAPFAEAKLVRCTSGSIFDVIIDLRSLSPTYLKHHSVHLSAENRLMLYIPEGFAHGFITLEENTEIFYQMSQYFTPNSARGIRWNDPLLEIPWPLEPKVISKRDQTYPDYEP